MHIDSLVTNKLKIKVNKTRQQRTQNLQKTYTACCKFCTEILNTWSEREKKETRKEIEGH